MHDRLKYLWEHSALLVALLWLVAAGFSLAAGHDSAFREQAAIGLLFMILDATTVGRVPVHITIAKTAEGDVEVTVDGSR